MVKQGRKRNIENKERRRKMSWHGSNSVAFWIWSGSLGWQKALKCTDGSKIKMKRYDINIILDNLLIS